MNLYDNNDDHNNVRSARFDMLRVVRENEGFVKNKNFELNVIEPLNILISSETRNQTGNKIAQIVFFEGTTNQAVLHYHTTNPESECAILNFANSKYPGGGYLNGSMAQEEELCRTIIDLYPSLKLNFTEFNWWEQIKYSPNLSLYKLDKVQSNGKYTFCKTPPKRISVSVITAAAPNLSTDETEKEEFLKNYRLTFEKLKNVIRECCFAPLNKGIDVLVLGAFGCGAFSPSRDIQSRMKYKYNSIVASLFIEVLTENPNLLTFYNYICFAIPSGDNYDEFKSQFQLNNIKIEEVIPLPVPKPVRQEIPKINYFNDTQQFDFGNDNYYSRNGWDHNKTPYTYNESSYSNDYSKTRYTSNELRHHHNESIYSGSYGKYSDRRTKRRYNFGGFSGYKFTEVKIRKENDFDDFTKRITDQGKTALGEILSGHKETHWMWYFFPQLDTLGMSDNSKFYGLKSLQEAEIFLQNVILGPFLIKMTKAVKRNMDVGIKMVDLFGTIDRQKFLSCMTLFYYASKNNDNQKIYNLFEECKQFVEIEMNEKDKKTMVLCGDEVTEDIIKETTQEVFLVDSNGTIQEVTTGKTPVQNENPQYETHTDSVYDFLNM